MENEEKVELISIKEIDILRNEISPAKELIYRDYSIKMPVLISWAKVEPELVLKNNKLEDKGYSSYKVLEDENAFVVNKTSKVVNVTVALYKNTEATYSKMVSFEDPTFTNDSISMNISLTNYLPNDVEIETLIIPISDGYTLTEKDFVKTQFFANYRGGIQGYTIEDETLILTYVRLEKNSSGTIALRLTKKDG
ncbi:hypothetical protein HWN40_03995 [Methanolobus zinderi]|uniref:Uncharacterized protein n=1 Tax=Methanolobus zinderi TaxID=536044 RepID=A0A7D5E734_9EURY|nr:hypothetical protein [Methanolobus zinderi]QLC49479.1 hypothetical protein HWN40_03995 [Methanolobus zinderi]